MVRSVHGACNAFLDEHPELVATKDGFPKVGSLNLAIMNEAAVIIAKNSKK